MKKIIIKTALILLSIVFTFSCSNKKKDIVIKNVNIIPMTNEIVLENMSVYISDGKIKEIGDYDSLTLPKKVETIDAEGKFLIPGLSDLYVQDLTEGELLLLLKNGVTTVRNIVGNNEILLYRSLIQKGKMPGPEIFTTGPALDKQLFMKIDPTGREYLSNIKHLVKQIKDNGYDYVYIHPGMKDEILDEVVRSAEKNQIPILNHYDVSNLIDKESFKKNILVSGTFSKQSYKQLENTIHNEFELVSGKGLTPYQILLTSTVNSAKKLKVFDRKGTIEVGKDADLVLLNKNPLEDIKNTNDISGVMTKGLWYTQEQLTEELYTLVDWYRE